MAKTYNSTGRFGELRKNAIGVLGAVVISMAFMGRIGSKRCARSRTAPRFSAMADS
jgi:hypothetical protein